MFGSPILDVAMALSFVFLLLSLVCSALNEMIAAVLALRQRALATAIETLLGDEKLRDLFYETPLIKTMHHGFFSYTSKPSYLSPDVFAAALQQLQEEVSRLGVSPATRAAATLQRTLEGELAKAEKVNAGDVTVSLATSELKLLLSAGDGWTDVGWLRALLMRAKGALSRTPEQEQDVGRLESASSALAATLGSIVSAGATAEDKAKAVARWFADAMDRVSGAYKRTVQIILLVLASVVVVATNGDSIAVARALWTNGELRASVADAAGKYVANAAPMPSAAPSSSSGQPPPADAWKAANANFHAATTQLDALKLPIGWSASDPKTSWLERVLGLLLTIVAVSLGAPFWFDMLSRITNLRSAGVKPKASEPAPGAKA
jgi:hypothetical protein